MVFDAELFDRLAPHYDESPPFFKTLGASLVAFAELPAGATVLDVGAGRGATTLPALAAVGARGRVTAVDFAPGMVEQLRALEIPNLAVELQDVTSLRLPPASHDHAVSGFTLHIVGDLEGAMAGIRRALRTGGTLSWSMPGTHPDATEFSEAYGRLFEDFMERIPGGAPASSDLPDRDSVMAQAGFEVVDRTSVKICMPVGGPEDYWEWTQTHGARWLTDALSDDDADAWRSAVIDTLVRTHPTGGRDIMVAPTFTKLRCA